MPTVGAILARFYQETAPIQDGRRWGVFCKQRIHPRALELHGYEKARRIGMVAMVGGKHKTRIRNATPPAFRDELLKIATMIQVAGPTG